ncbi:MAG TPA: hypothetical protein VFY36_03320 [Solirubrobacteraceae bacterium]|nr:hypothetical protein [Solirubrobacteraceae bacterium]
MISSRPAPPTAIARRGTTPAGTLEIGIAVFAAMELGLAVFMAVAPHAFYEAIGPFGVFNPHYLRDVASFEGAIGIALLVSLRRRSWRAPVLALTTLQFALHSVNHLVDIGRAHPRWAGFFDFLSLAPATLLLAYLWRAASLETEGSST